MPHSISIGPLLLPTSFLVLVACYFFAKIIFSQCSNQFKLTQTQSKSSEKTIEQGFYLGIVLARLGVVVQFWSAYQTQPWTALYFWQAGFTWFYGIYAALLFLFCMSALQYSKTKSFKPLLPLIISAGLAMALYSSVMFFSERQHQADYKNQDQAFKSIELINLSDKTVNLNSLKGQNLIVNLWATWCGPCRREMTMLNDMQQSFSHENDTIIIAINTAEEKAIVHNYLNKQFNNQTLSMRIWLDLNNEIFNSIEAQGTPTTLFIDKKGQLVDIKVGELSRGYIEQQLASMNDATTGQNNGK